MTWDTVPWFVGGGAEHSPEIARLLAYASTGAAEGVIAPGDLKVVALAVPGDQLRVLAGACLVRNRAAGGAEQTYVGRNPDEDLVDVPASGSSGSATHMIVARVEDPFEAGEVWQEPADVTVGPYIFSRLIPNVPTTAIASPAAAQDYLTTQGYSAIPLAGVTVPPSTGTFDDSMVTDLRALATPRTSTDVQVIAANQDGDYDLDQAQWMFWPASGNGFNSDIHLPVPKWATTAYVEVQVNSFAHVAPEFIGELRILLDQVGGTSTAVDLDLTTGAEHCNQTVWAEFDVTGFQGQNVPIALQGKRWDGYTGLLRTRPWTQYVMRTNFYERAV